MIIRRIIFYPAMTRYPYPDDVWASSLRPTILATVELRNQTSSVDLQPKGSAGELLPKVSTKK